VLWLAPGAFGRRRHRLRSLRFLVGRGRLALHACTVTKIRSASPRASPMRHVPPHPHAAALTPPTATTQGSPARTTFTAALVHSPIAFSSAASSGSSLDSQITPVSPLRSFV